MANILPRDRGQRKFAVDIARAEGEGYIYCKLPMTEVEGSIVRHIHRLTMIHIIYLIHCDVINVGVFCFRCLNLNSKLLFSV